MAARVISVSLAPNNSLPAANNASPVSPAMAAAIASSYGYVSWPYFPSEKNCMAAQHFQQHPQTTRREEGASSACTQAANALDRNARGMGQEFKQHDTQYQAYSAYGQQHPQKHDPRLAYAFPVHAQQATSCQPPMYCSPYTSHGQDADATWSPDCNTSDQQTPSKPRTADSPSRRTLFPATPTSNSAEASDVEDNAHQDADSSDADHVFDFRVTRSLSHEGTEPQEESGDPALDRLYVFEDGVYSWRAAMKQHQLAQDSYLRVERGRRASRAKRRRRELGLAEQESEESDDGAKSTTCPHCSKCYRQNNR